MADEELVKILLEDGVEAWNEFVFQKKPSWIADLNNADLHSGYLCEVDLRGANLIRANLGAALLHGADLLGANLQEAHCFGADLSEADLRSARFRGAGLASTVLRGADLRDANLSEADLGSTVFAGVDLSETRGLERASHLGPSHIDQSTLRMSRGKIPADFLRGCGFADWEVEQAQLYNPDLEPDEVVDILYEAERLRNAGPIQVNSVFLSYSRHDSDFVDKFQAALDDKGVRTWRDTKDAEAGPLDRVLGRAIEINRIVLIVLSESSCYSDWVRFEIEKALELEKTLRRPVLCPVAIDGAWLEMLPAKLLPRVKDYNVIDLSEKGSIEEKMPLLLKGLQIHYRGEAGDG